MAGPCRDDQGAPGRLGALHEVIAPGFTGSPIDRADHLRHDPEALAAAMGDWRARLLRLDGFDPVVSDDGRLEWTSVADTPEDAELVFLGLLDGKPHFAAAIPGLRTVAGRPPHIFALLDRLRPEEAETYA